MSGYNLVLCGSGVPGWTILTPDQFRRSYLAGSLHTFHAVFSYSSVEHSGLGRYGDTLNPWGDLMAVAEAWCVAGPGARLALAVPQTGAGSEQEGGGGAVWANVHRIYSPPGLARLATNWRFSWRPRSYSVRPPDPGDDFEYRYQPLYVFDKIPRVQ